MTTPDWERDDARVLGVFLNGDGVRERGPRGEALRDDSFLLLLNAHHEDVDYVLPAAKYGRRWVVELTTADREERQRGKEQDAGGPVTVMSRSLLLLRRLA
jgi:glycogen operon protein